MPTESSHATGVVEAPLTDQHVIEDPMGHDGEHVKMPYAHFFLATGGQLALALVLYWLIAPTMFRSEFASPWAIVLTTFLLGIPISLFEYLYHRYLLHSAVLPFMSSMMRAHVTHHGLTNVKASVKAQEPEKLAPVRSEYAIIEKHQEESMMFPLYSISIFYAVFLLLLGLPVKLLFPAAPVLVSTIFVATLSYSAYEIWHAILHLPFEKVWKPLMLKKSVGKLTSYIYGFHLMHHWRPTANQAVVGFWGVALWDHLFRTHKRPERMPLDKHFVNYYDGSLPTPRWPIKLLDKWQGSMMRWSRKTDNTLARIFLGRGKKTG